MIKPEENINTDINQKPSTPGSVKKQRVTVIICSVAVLILIFMICYFVTYRENMAERLAAEREMAEINAVLNVETIYSNVYVNDINIGGLTKEQAKQTLEAQNTSAMTTEKIGYIWDDENYHREFTFEQLGASYDFDRAINEAYSFGRINSDPRARYAEIIENKDRGTYIRADWVFDEKKAEECVDLVCKDIDKDAVNASVSYSGGKLSFSDSQTGRKVDRDRLVEMTNSVLETRESGDIVLEVEITEPEFTREELEFEPKVIGSCTSAYGTGNNDRVENLRIAAEKINGKIIYPGKTFSTNEALSPFTEESGYKYAGAYINGELVEDIGGGVCQVSSALYNAALNAELYIAERYNHSKKVGYMDYGYDATLAGDVKDLKITNNTSAPVIIQAKLENNAVKIDIVGKEEHDPGRTIEFFNKKTGETDSTVTYELYKNIYQNGELTDTVKINKSTYNTK